MYRMDIGPNDGGPTFLNIVEEDVVEELMKKYTYTKSSNGVITIESRDRIVFRFRKITPETIKSMDILFFNVEKKEEKGS